MKYDMKLTYTEEKGRISKICVTALTQAAGKELQLKFPRLRKLLERVPTNNN